MQPSAALKYPVEIIINNSKKVLVNHIEKQLEQKFSGGYMGWDSPLRSIIFVLQTSFP